MVDMSTSAVNVPITEEDSNATNIILFDIGRI